MERVLESLVKCLALDPAALKAYLRPCPRTPVLVHDPQVEILTRKPLLIIALLVRNRPYSDTWWTSLTQEQQTAYEQLHAVIATMVELGVWVLFSDEPHEQEVAAEYYPIWGVCRLLACSCILKFGWTPGSPPISFGSLLEQFTTPMSEWSEMMVR